MERHDLNGAFTTASQGKFAIVINGSCCVIENKAVKDALFGTDKLIEPIEINNISIGQIINDGSCLIRGDAMHEIFLLTGFPHTRRHLIVNYETFQKLNFDMSQVKTIPWLALQSIPVGQNILSTS